MILNFTVLWVFALNMILKYIAKQLSISTFPQKCHGAVFSCNYKEWWIPVQRFLHFTGVRSQITELKVKVAGEMSLTLYLMNHIW